MLTPILTSIVIWHTFDVLPAETLSKHVQEYAAQQNVDVRLETGMDLVQSLLELELLADPGGKSQALSYAPDAVIGPSDMIGLAGDIGLYPVAAVGTSMTDGTVRYQDGLAKLVQMQGHYWGYPLLSGNHLLLYHQKPVPVLSVLSPARTDPDDRVALQPGEPYIFMMLVLGQLNAGVKTASAEDITEDMLTRALRDYKTLMASDMVASPCDYQCVTRDFFQGKWQYALNGDWALADARKFLPEFRIAPLPSYNGVRWRSPCTLFAMMQTKKAGSDPAKQKFLRGLAMHLAAPGPQRDWFETTRRVPVNRNVFEEIRTAAKGNDEILFDELGRAVCLLPDRKISAMWPALRKGIRLYSSGAKTAEDTARYILRLAN